MSAPREDEAGDAPVQRPQVIERVTVVDEELLVDPAPRARRWRLGLLALLFVGSLAAGKAAGLEEWLDVERLRGLVEGAGPLGFLVYLVAFSAGELLHFPGMIFLGVASVVYPPWVAVPLAYVGAVGAVVTTFYVVRKVGGQPLADVRRPWLRRMLEKLDARPIRTIIALRLIFSMAPALNYALAMSEVRARDYVIGSAIGLVVPVTVVTIFFERLVAYLL